jgi:hypothetical protein
VRKETSCVGTSKEITATKVTYVSTPTIKICLNNVNLRFNSVKIIKILETASLKMGVLMLTVKTN